MTKPEVVCVPMTTLAGYIWSWAIYCDYPEQALLACIVQGLVCKVLSLSIISYHYYL